PGARPGREPGPLVGRGPGRRGAREPVPRRGLRHPRRRDPRRGGRRSRSVAGRRAHGWHRHAHPGARRATAGPPRGEAAGFHRHRSRRLAPVRRARSTESAGQVQSVQYNGRQRSMVRPWRRLPFPLVACIPALLAPPARATEEAPVEVRALWVETGVIPHGLRRAMFREAATLLAPGRVVVRWRTGKAETLSDEDELRVLALDRGDRRGGAGRLLAATSNGPG